MTMTLICLHWIHSHMDQTTERKTDIGQLRSFLMRFDVKVKCVFSTPRRAAYLLPGNSLVFKEVPFLSQPSLLNVRL